MEGKYTIKEEHIEYYKYLEQIRRSGIVNMFGASVILEKDYNLKPKLAGEILLEWIENYNELNKRFNWQ